MNNIYSNGLVSKKHHKLLSSKQVAKTILTTSLMASFLKKTWEKYLTNLLKNTFVVRNVNCLKCTCRLLEIKYKANVILVLLLETSIISTSWQHLSLKTRQLPKVWLQARLSKFKQKSLWFLLKWWKRRSSSKKRWKCKNR